MGGYNICKQLESYSNAITAFIVLQGLGFCYQFGVNSGFKTIVQQRWTLSVVLLALFTAVLVGSLYANRKISVALQNRLDENDKSLAKHISIGKAAVIVLFGLLPILVTLLYGLLALPF